MADAHPLNVFGVGPARSGTHYLASLFQPPLRAAHEPDGPAVIRLIRNRHEGLLSASSYRDQLRARHHRNALDIDVSQLNYFLLDFLRTDIPGARYILTLRDPIAWLTSFVNHALLFPGVRGEWHWLRAHRFRPDCHPHTRHETNLQTRGLYSLDGYLSYYSRHLAEVADAIPPEHLLILRTETLGQHIGAIAAFLGVAPTALGTGGAIRVAWPATIPLTDLVPAAFLQDRVQSHCAAILERLDHRAIG